MAMKTTGETMGEAMKVTARAMVSAAVVGLAMALATPAMAATPGGGAGGQVGQGINSMFQDVIAFLTGPTMVSVATIAFIVALVGAYFGGASDAMKKVLMIVAVTAAIMAAPGIITQVVSSASAGALL